MIANLGGPMSVLMPASLLSALVLCVLLVRGRQPGASLLAGSALVLMTTALVITLAVNVPIDRQIQTWTTAALPADWQAVRDRWEFYHGLRTVVSIAALACLFAATLSTRWRRAPDGRKSRTSTPARRGLQPRDRPRPERVLFPRPPTPACRSIDVTTVCYDCSHIWNASESGI
jgi:hypothetical protein